MDELSWIVYDFDGTLADSFRQAHRIFNRLAPRYHYQPVPDEDVEQMRNRTTMEFFAEMGVPLILVPVLAIQARRELNRHMAEIQPVEGVPAMLEALRARGFRQGVLTSNAKENVELFLGAHGLRDYFDFIYSSRDMFGKDRRVKALIRKYGLEPAHLIYVGDTDSDIHAARRAGIRVVGVSWGYQARAQLERAKPTWLIDRPGELLDVLAS